MVGLRGQESSKFNKFFSIVQTTALEKGCVFFVEAADGNFFENDDIECEDLMGWLIPKDKISEFETEWIKNDVSDDWTDFFVWATWENATNPKISFTE